MVITKHEVARRHAGFTVTQLAQATGFSHAYVSRLEGRDLRPSPSYLNAAAAVLGVAPEDLLEPAPPTRA